MKMKRKTIYCMLSLCLLISASVKAQVRIGGLDNPNPSAVLDLNATDAANNGALGLALPRVALTSTTSYAPLKAHVAGMTVYNTANNSYVTPGTYYNDGSGWVRIGSVSSVELTSEEDGVIGNEVLGATPNGGLTRVGSGTAASPFTLGIANNGVTTARIADSNVTTAKIADGNVTTAKIDADAVTTAKIADGTVAAVDLASDAVTTAKILDANVTLNKLALNSVNSDKIVNGTIVADDLANGAVTAAKLATMNATANQALVYNGSAWVPTTLSTVAISGGYGYGIPTVAATGCDGSILYIGAFDYVSGTSGDVAKGVTNATNTADHATLPTLSSTPTDADFNHNPSYYLCVYKKDGNGGSTTTWANAVNNCANGTYADNNASAGWYLPNARELKVIYENLKNGVSFFDLRHGTIVSYTNSMASANYWVSTEYSATNAWVFIFSGGSYLNNAKALNSYYVRCVRRLSSI
jgi:hypothetical protein